MIKKIISGGQTGADQAALDVAIKLNIPHGGWIQKGRKTEEGPLPDQYLLQEMPTASYPKRTEQNIFHSDGTLIFSHGKLTGGSKLTRDLAAKKNRPSLHVDLKLNSVGYTVRLIQEWLHDNGIKTLNVAGPRASGDPAIYGAVVKVLELVFKDRKLS
jgi:hypothetical protein